jgi:sugar phosphate isomerase/epimerase
MKCKEEISMKLCISSYSLRSEFGTDGIDIYEFIRMAREDFGADAVELMPMNIDPSEPTPKQTGFGGIDWEKLSPEERMTFITSYLERMRKWSLILPKNLDKVKATLKKYGVKVMNMPLDFGNISNHDEKERNEDIAILKSWIDVAAELGSKSVRVNTGFTGTANDMDIIVESYKELAEYGATKNVVLALENHGGASADPDNILKLFQKVGNPNFRICPDFGNFEDDIRFEALDKIFSLNPVLVHAKAYDFDENDNMTRFDFGKCMEVAKKNGYDGYYSVEFEGQGDQVDGVKKTIALLKRYL